MENIQCTEIICPCCKTGLQNSDDLYIKISCGHEYHYDCIYDAFIFNRKRNVTILECPYCRLSVSHIPEKEGFNFDITIHLGIKNCSDASWFEKHFGEQYCYYNNNGLYCNKYFIYGCGKEQKYCSKHKNSELLGIGHCPILKGTKYCNIKCDNEKKYCYYHSNYENCLECDYILQKGDKKGQLCAKLTTNNNSKCILHNKCINANMHKTCVAIIKKGKNIGNICGRKSYNDYDYCKSHSKLVNELNVINLD